MSKRTGTGGGSKNFNIFRYLAWFRLIDRNIMKFGKHLKDTTSQLEKMMKQRDKGFARQALIYAVVNKQLLKNTKLFKDLATSQGKYNKQFVNYHKELNKVFKQTRNPKKRAREEEKFQKHLLKQRRIMETKYYARTRDDPRYFHKQGLTGCRCVYFKSSKVFSAALAERLLSKHYLVGKIFLYVCKVLA